MDAIETMLARRSYRGKYKAVPIPKEDLMTILEAGLAAPSGCNKQTVSLIAVDNPAVLQRLHAVIDPPVGETAPAMICVLSQKINLQLFYDHQGTTPLISSSYPVKADNVGLNIKLMLTR